MAIAYRSDTGTLVADGVSGAQSIAFVTTQPSAGDLVISGGGMYGGGTAFTPTLADNQGNGNYTKDEDVAQGTDVIHATIASKANVASSGTFSVSFNTGNSGSYYAVGGIAFSGAATSTPLDVHTNATAGSGTISTQGTGTTGATSQADEVAIIALGINSGSNAGTITATGYTVSVKEGNATAHMIGALAYKILAATGTQTGTFAFTSVAVNGAAAAIATYKGAGGASTVTVNQVTETDTAQPITSQQARALGQPSETDLAQPITSQQRRTLGQATETDLAQPLASISLGISQASETDLAQPIALGSSSVAVGQASETDLAQPLGAISLGINQASETDTAQPITAQQVRALGQTTETDLAQAIVARQVNVLGIVTETDEAQPITVAGGPIDVGQVSETDQAMPITPVQPVDASTQAFGGGWTMRYKKKKEEVDRIREDLAKAIESLQPRPKTVEIPKANSEFTPEIYVPKVVYAEMRKAQALAEETVAWMQHMRKAVVRARQRKAINQLLLYGD